MSKQLQPDETIRNIQKKNHKLYIKCYVCAQIRAPSRVNSLQMLPVNTAKDTFRLNLGPQTTGSSF